MDRQVVTRHVVLAANDERAEAWLEALDVDTAYVTPQTAEATDDTVALERFAAPTAMQRAYPGPDGWMRSTQRVPLTVEPTEFGLQWITKVAP